jgi:hypothetical protein
MLRFAVRLTPKGGRDAILGWEDGPDGKRYLKVRVSAPAEGGKANAALTRLLAKLMGIAPGKVRIVSGTHSRMKMVEVETLASLPATLGKAG